VSAPSKAPSSSSSSSSSAAASAAAAAAAASHFLKLKSRIIKIVQSRNGC